MGMAELPDYPALSPIRVSTAYWPVVVFELPEGKISDANARAMFDCMEAVLSQGVKGRQKAFIVSDFTAVREIPPASQRKYAGEWLERNTQLCRAGSLGTAHVTPSAVLRGLITAIFWIHPSPTPSFCVRTLRDGVLKGIELLETSGAPLPPRLASFRSTTATNSSEIRR
jgi:hypothetical protein